MDQKYICNSAPECPFNRHLAFRKNVNNFALHKDILHIIIWEDAPPPCGDDHVTT